LRRVTGIVESGLFYEDAGVDDCNIFLTIIKSWARCPSRPTLYVSTHDVGLPDRKGFPKITERFFYGYFRGDHPKITMCAANHADFAIKADNNRKIANRSALVLPAGGDLSVLSAQISTEKNSFSFLTGNSSSRQPPCE